MNIKQLWKQFDKEAEACYAHWNGEIRMDWKDSEIRTWRKAYETVMEILRTGREQDPAFCRELSSLDETTGYTHDLGTWMEDYLDVLDMAEAYPELLESLDDLLGSFDWEEVPPTDLKMLRTIVLGRLGRHEEAWEYASAWQQQEPEDQTAVSACVYAAIPKQQWETAERLLASRLPADVECTEENELLFRAKLALCHAQGKEEEAAKIEKQLAALEEQIMSELNGLFDGDFDLDDIPV